MEKNGNGQASTTALVYAKRGKHFISTWWNHVDSFQCCRILAGHNLVKEKNCVAKKCCMGSSKEVFRGNYFEGVKEIKIQILYSVHSADSHQKTDKVIELHSSQSLPQPSPTLFNLALKALNATWSEVKGRTKCYIQGWTEIKFWKWKKALYFLGPTWSRGWYHTLVRYFCSIPLNFPTVLFPLLWSWVVRFVDKCSSVGGPVYLLPALDRLPGDQRWQQSTQYP